MTDTPISLAAVRGDAEQTTTGYVVWPQDVVLALVEAVSAAQAFTRLPLPVSSDERVEWLTAQGNARAALSRFVSEQPPNGKSESLETGA